MLTLGGFDLAARWTTLVAFVALAIAWSVLPRRLPEAFGEPRTVVLEPPT
jgi:hypothetical protein